MGRVSSGRLQSKTPCRASVREKLPFALDEPNKEHLWLKCRTGVWWPSNASQRWTPPVGKYTQNLPGEPVLVLSAAPCHGVPLCGLQVHDLRSDLSPWQWGHTTPVSGPRFPWCGGTLSKLSLTCLSYAMTTDLFKGQDSSDHGWKRLRCTWGSQRYMHQIQPNTIDIFGGLLFARL